MLCPIEILATYETGLARVYHSNQLLFHWHDWVVCEVKNYATNIPHAVIMTNFRPVRWSVPGPLDHKNIFVTRWNPTYEGNEHREKFCLASLHLWRPLLVIPQQSMEMKMMGETDS